MIKYPKRCVCGAVSSPEIASDTARVSPKAFFRDPKDELHFICSDCYEAIANQRYDYLLSDLEGKTPEYGGTDSTKTPVWTNPYVNDLIGGPLEPEPLDEEMMEQLFLETDEEVDGLK